MEWVLEGEMKDYQNATTRLLWRIRFTLTIIDEQKNTIRDDIVLLLEHLYTDQ